MRVPRTARASFGALIFACALHLTFVVSLRTGTVNPLFIEAQEGYKQASDYFGIYQAGANLMSGYSVYDSGVYLHEAPTRTSKYYFYRYLPPTAYVFGPVSLLLPPRPAYWLSVTVCEAIVLWIVITILRDTRWPTSRRYLAASLWLGCFPFYSEQYMGQFSLVMAAFVWILWRGEIDRTLPTERERPGLHAILARWRTYRWSNDRILSRTAVLAWVGAMSVKTYPVLFAIPFLRDRRLKTVLLGGALAVLLSLPYFLFRPADFVEFVRLNLTPFTPSLHKGSFGLHTFLRDAFTHLPPGLLSHRFEVGPIDMTIPGLFILGIAALIYVLALRATLRLADHPNRATLDLAIWSAVFFLTYKSIWEYHFVMLLPVLSALLLTTGSRTVFVLGVLLGLPTLYSLTAPLTGLPETTPVLQLPAWFRSLHYASKSIPTLALFLWVLRRAAGGGGPAH